MEITIHCRQCGKKTKHRHDSYYNSEKDWQIKFVCTECECAKLGTMEFNETKSIPKIQTNQQIAELFNKPFHDENGTWFK